MLRHNNPKASVRHLPAKRRQALLQPTVLAPGFQRLSTTVAHCCSNTSTKSICACRNLDELSETCFLIGLLTVACARVFLA